MRTLGPGGSRKGAVRRLTLTALALFAAFGAHAQSIHYPVRPVRMVVPFAPGGASDLVARMVSPRLSQDLGQQIVVDNRGGASGNIGVEMAVRAPADGYTVVINNVSTGAINPIAFAKTLNVQRVGHRCGRDV